MHRYVALPLVLVALLLTARTVSAHCQVPCGIFSDQLRFEQMLEDTRTISKAMVQISELSEKEDALSHNQLARWVITKEEHAQGIQEIVAEYFLAQRIKPTNEKYIEQLKAAHAVTVAAMKCKQSVDPATAKVLEEAIFNLYRAYEGKEPHFHD